MEALAVFMTVFTVVGLVYGVVSATAEETGIFGFLKVFLTFAILVPLAVTLFFGVVWVILYFWLRVFYAI